MENFKLVIFLSVFSAFFFPALISAYDAPTSHRLITDDAVAVFNRYFPANKFSSTETEQILTGSIEEDNGLRSFSHFYDPVYGRGIIKSGIAYESSKKWAEDTSGQGGTAVLGNLAAGTVSSYFSGDSDYSWDRAVYEYVHGDKNRGLQALGHVLHLIEDATVPDHTRNDDHIPYYTQYTGQASPFEMYAKDQTGPTVSEVLTAGVQPIIYSSLDHYFDAVALYSNSNFFSKDSIFDKQYQGPSVSLLGKEEGCFIQDKKCTFGINSHSEKIVADLRTVTKTGEVINEYFLIDDNKIILSSYYQNLSLQAIANSAGVIKLFFDSVEEEKRTGALALKNKSWLDRALALVGLTGDRATSTPPTTPATTPPLGQEGIKDLGAGLPNGDDGGMTQAEYLQSRILRLQTQLLAAQIASDPNADWPPVDNVCPMGN